MRVFVDFDYTLCNTVLLKQDIVAVSRAHGVTLVSLPESRETYNRIGHYTLKKHFELSQCPQDVAREIETDFFSRASQWLYPDALDFLKRNSHHELIVLSYGDAEFQRRKIHASGVTAVVSNVICCETPKVEALQTLVETDEMFVVIDDRATHLDSIAEHYPNVRCVRVTRPESPYLTEIAQSSVTISQDLSFDINELQ